MNIAIPSAARKWCLRTCATTRHVLETIIICELPWRRPPPPAPFYCCFLCCSSSQHALTFVRCPVCTPTNNQPGDCFAGLVTPAGLASLQLPGPVHHTPSFLSLFFWLLYPRCLLPGLLINFFRSPVPLFSLDKSIKNKEREYKNKSK
jgi:hypothetical protein